MKKKEMAVLAAVCAVTVGNLGNMEIIQAFAENGNGKILEIEETQEPLSICVEEEHERMMRQIVTAWQKMYGGEQTELIVIPSGEEASKQKVQEIREAIVSGGGPDLFLAESPNPAWSEPKTVLFSDPKKEMEQGTFLSLEPYLEYFDTRLLDERILVEGRTREEQMVLPMTYDYFLYAFDAEDLPQNKKLPESWEELIGQEEKAIRQTAGQRSGIQFFDIFGQLADYKKGELLLSEYQLREALDEAAEFGSASLKMDWKMRDTGVVSLNTIEGIAGEKAEHTLFAFPNGEGGVTANITLYAGINKNTKQPKKAVSFLSLLYSEEILSGKGIAIDGRMEGCSVKFPQGVSVYEQDLEKRMRSLSKEDQEQMRKIQKKITAVRFCSELDGKLNTLLAEYSAQSDEKQKDALIETAMREWENSLK